jgi:predicted PurR-regulated permease PerM
VAVPIKTRKHDVTGKPAFVRVVFAFAFVAASGVLAMRLFIVRELIAALVIFSVLFACLVGLVLVLVFLNHAFQTAFTWAQTYRKAYITERHRKLAGAHKSCQWRLRNVDASFANSRLATRSYPHKRTF